MDPIVLASYEDVAISLLNLASHKIISSLESISKTCPFWKLPAKPESVHCGSIPSNYKSEILMSVDPFSTRY